MTTNSHAFYVDDYDSAQAAVNAAVAKGGGVVEFGVGTYDVNHLRLEYGSRQAVVTLRGQGFGHELSPTVLQVPDGGVGIEIVNTDPGRCMTAHLSDFEVRGGDIGIHLVKVGQAYKNMHWRRLAARLQLKKGIWIEGDSFANLYSQILIMPVYRGPGETAGFYVQGHQNTNTYQRLEIRQAGWGFVSDVETDGAGGNSVLRDCLLEGNIGPAIRFFNSRDGETTHETQFNGWRFENLYFETNGATSGEPDIVIEGHLHDFTANNIISGPPSTPQLNYEHGPVLMDVRGVGRRYLIEGVAGGGKSIRFGGRVMMTKDHYSMTTMSRHLNVHSDNGGGPVLLDEATGKYHRVYVSNGQLMLQDVTINVLG